MKMKLELPAALLLLVCTFLGLLDKLGEALALL